MSHVGDRETISPMADMSDSTCLICSTPPVTRRRQFSSLLTTALSVPHCVLVISPQRHHALFFLPRQRLYEAHFLYSLPQCSRAAGLGPFG